MLVVDLLIKRHDNHVPPGVPSAHCYRLGDIVTWRKHPHSGWGLEEDPDVGAQNFFIITVTGVPVNETTLRLRDWIEGEYDDTDPQNPLLIRLRRFRLHPDDVPQAVRDVLQATGRYTATWVQVRQFVTNRL